MTTFTQRVATLPASIGWTGGFGVAFLVAACVLGATLLRPALEEGDELRQQLLQLERRPGKVAAPAQTEATLRQQLDEFLASLPKQDQINAQLAVLHEVAARNRLALRDGEYRTTTGKGGRIGRLQITLKTAGSYTEVRRFLQELPAALPAMAVSRVAMSRQKPADAALETTVEFALFFTRAAT